MVQNHLEAATLNSSLCDYSNAYILVKETITITGGLAAVDKA